MTKQDIIIKILKDKEITPSYARIKIYDYLSKGKIHPTVDQIFMDLVKILPTLSKTTVYNTLNLFVEKDLIKAVNLGNNKMRYELLRSEHGHFKCSNCSSVFDIPINIDIELPKELTNSHINEYHHLIIGICPDCLNKE